METWQAQLETDVREALAETGVEMPRAFLGDTEDHNSIHLAVLTEPYLEWILAGKKTIESRFSVNRVAPYGAISPGDCLVLKRSSGPIVGLCTVSDVEFFELDRSTRAQIRADYGRGLCAETPEFWKAREHACYATLMHIDSVIPLPPLSCAKRDRRGWVVLPLDSTTDDQLTLPGHRPSRSNRRREVEHR
ncbi:MAG: ASCH domain-containing protein [bacterium]|nr:ASCH domain-containing protein [bacterium]